MKNKKLLLILLFLLIIPIKANAQIKTNFHLEVPTVNSTTGKSMIIAGWLMTESNDPKIHMYIDNNEITPTINRFSRPDVVKSNPNYSNNQNNKQAGFNTTVDLSQYKDGKHILTINVLDYDKKEVLSQYSTVFYIQKSKTVLHLEKPTQNLRIQNNMTISGWLMSTNKDATIEYYLNRNKIDIETIRAKRPDVIKSMPGYGGETTNPTPGFKAILDMSNYEDGEYFLEVKIIDKTTNEILTGDSRTIKVKKYDSHINIDHPQESDSVGSNIRFDGWFLSELENSKIEIYLDDQLLENEITRTAREDVLKAMNYSYGGKETNKAPGFSTTIDASNIADGNHTIELRIINPNTNEIINKSIRKINLDKNKTFINIDHPVGTQKEKIKIDGWYLSANPDNSLKILVDDKEVTNTITRAAREDVLKAMNYGYGGKETNKKPGFGVEFDARNLLDGEHTVTIQIINNKDNTILREEKRKFTLKKYNSFINIDHPTNKTKESMTVDGWYLSECSESDIELYIDNEKVDVTFSRTGREDVLKAMNYGYGGTTTNKKPGYSTNYGLKNYKDGKHTITIKIIDKVTNEYIATSSKTINLSKYDALVNIDNPKTTTNRNMKVSGWSLSTTDSDIIEVLVDNTKVEANITRSAREDVISGVPGYGGIEKNKTPGFNTTIDLTSYKDGKHTVTIRVIDATTLDVIQSTSKEFNLKKYDGILNIDNPKTNMINQPTLVIEGWEKSELDESYIEIYIDGKNTNAPIARFARQDVIDGVAGYGTITENATPGFNTTIDISNLSVGKHTLTVKLYTKLKEIITEETKEFIKYGNIYFGIDVSEHNGKIDWSAVAKDGISFAFLRVGYRGYGTAAVVEDKTFEYNIKESIKNNISTGVYFYTQAINENEAIGEADFSVGTLQKYGMLEKTKLPIVIDTEYTDYHIGRADNLTQHQRTQVVKAFAQRIRQHGYTPMIYASRDFLYFNLNMAELSDCDVWLAHYTSATDPMNNQSNYRGTYKVWQYTSKGSVSGINGLVDRNISYVKY